MGGIISVDARVSIFNFKSQAYFYAYMGVLLRLVTIL